MKSGQAREIMESTALRKFIEYCHVVQPQSTEEIQRFFEGVLFFPFDKELLLQAHLFFTIKDRFPECERLLLFEKAPIEGRTDLGKCDFVYLTKLDTILLIETKFIDKLRPESNEETAINCGSGKTWRRRRTAKRKQVFEQVQTMKESFAAVSRIPDCLFDCAVFTTDPGLMNHLNAGEVRVGFIDQLDLEAWRSEQLLNF